MLSGYVCVLCVCEYKVLDFEEMKNLRLLFVFPFYFSLFCLETECISEKINEEIKQPLKRQREKTK